MVGVGVDELGNFEINETALTPIDGKNFTYSKTYDHGIYEVFVGDLSQEFPNKFASLYI
jgi:hypothetical protein